MLANYCDAFCETILQPLEMGIQEIEDTLTSLLHDVMGSAGDQPLKGVRKDDLIEKIEPSIKQSDQKNNKLLDLLENFPYFRVQDNNDWLDVDNLMIFFIKHLKGEEEARQERLFKMLVDASNS